MHQKYLDSQQTQHYQFFTWKQNYNVIPLSPNLPSPKWKIVQQSEMFLCCFNSLWPGDAIWWHKSELILAQVMACCLTAPSHHPNQCWLLIKRSSGIHLKAISHKIPPQPSIIKMRFKIDYLKFNLNLLGANDLTHLPLVPHICDSESGQHWFR